MVMNIINIAVCITYTFTSAVTLSGTLFLHTALSTVAISSLDISTALASISVHTSDTGVQPRR